VILGLDDTIERRRGAQIKAKGIYRDPVRSSHGHFVKASGLRWLSLIAAHPVFLGGSHLGSASPDCIGTFRTVLPEQSGAAQKLTEWACRWFFKLAVAAPTAAVVIGIVVLPVIQLLFRLRQLKNPVAAIMRFRMDAALYERSKMAPGAMGRPRRKGNACRLWKSCRR